MLMSFITVVGGAAAAAAESERHRNTPTWIIVSFQSLSQRQLHPLLALTSADLFQLAGHYAAPLFVRLS